MRSHYATKEPDGFISRTSRMTIGKIDKRLRGDFKLDDAAIAALGEIPKTRPRATPAPATAAPAKQAPAPPAKQAPAPPAKQAPAPPAPAKQQEPAAPAKSAKSPRLTYKTLAAIAAGTYVYADHDLKSYRKAIQLELKVEDLADKRAAALKAARTAANKLSREQRKASGTTDAKSQEPVKQARERRTPAGDGPYAAMPHAELLELKRSTSDAATLKVIKKQIRINRKSGANQGGTSNQPRQRQAPSQTRQRRRPATGTAQVDPALAEIIKAKNAWPETARQAVMEIVAGLDRAYA